MNNRLTAAVCAGFVWLSTTAAWGAPLFPDVPDSHWATDAVRSLAAKGLVEGYPDGTFKGDRAASRYEAAMIVARLLAKMEQEHATFATKADLDEVRKLVDALREELEALGIRVVNLEENTERLDKRVTELERITFAGSIKTRYVANSFRNRGNNASGVGPGTTNYATAVGGIAGSNLFPTLGNGVMPVIDFTNGRPLTNGTGMSSTMYLDIGFRPNDEFRADMRLFSYVSQGDSVVDAVWGTTPPYLANSFTGRNSTVPSLDANQALSHAPFTQMGLDRLSVVHEPTQIGLELGTYNNRFMSTAVFIGEANPGIQNPRVLENYGAHFYQDKAPWGWETFYTRLPDGFPGNNAPTYQSDAYGGAVNWSDENWVVGLSAIRAANQAAPGGPFTVGQVSPQNSSSPAAFYLNWVNPPGFYVSQLGGIGSTQVAGAGSVTDTRPIPGLVDSDSVNTGASFGPQEDTMAGVSVNYDSEPFIAFAEYNYSHYRPNRNSGYSRDGNLWKIGLEADLLDDELELRAEWRQTDPTYDPMSLSFPGTAAGVGIFRVYHRVPDFSNFWHQYSLHNTKDYPHNRKGLWTSAKWQYDPDGFLKIGYRDLSQVQNSLQDVRFNANSLAPGTPNAQVIGFSPGRYDPVFRGYSNLSFTGANLDPIENQRGRVGSYDAQVSHVFTGSPWRVDASYERWHFTRPTTATAAQGGSQNHVDYTELVGRASLGYQATENFLITAGYEQGRWMGHYDPQGRYNPYAIANNDVNFFNTDTKQDIPFLDLNWEAARDLRIGTTFRWYDTSDHVPTSIFSGAPGGPGSTAHPFAWSGWQIATSVDFTF